MNWLILWYALQVGIAPSSGMVDYSYNTGNYDSTATLYSVHGYTQLETELRFYNNLFFLGGMIRTEIQGWNGQLNFMPELSSYGFTFGIRYGGAELGFLHVCEHPTVPYYAIYMPYLKWDGWYTEVHLRFSGDAKIF